MKKRWMSGTLALLLAGTTVASMMPAVSVKAEGIPQPEQHIMLIPMGEMIAMKEHQKARRSGHLTK